MKRCYENSFNTIPLDAFNYLYPHLDTIAKKSLSSVDQERYKACSDKVESLRLFPSKNMDVPVDILPRLIKRFPNLRKLEFGSHEEKHLRALIAYLKNHPLSRVRSLKIHEIRGNLYSKHIEELKITFLKAVVHPQLESLIIKAAPYFWSLEGKKITPLLNKLPLLKKFEFNGELGECSFKNNKELTTLKFNQLTGYVDTIKSLNACTNLTSLSIECLDCSPGLIPVLSQQPLPLRGLEVPWIESTDDLNALTIQFPELEHFSVIRNFNPKPADLRALSFNCTKLRTLKIGYSNLDDNDLFHLTQGLLQLEVFSFEGPELTEDGVVFITENCPNLHKLTLRYLESLNRTGIEAIVKNCPKITKLELSETGPIAYDDLQYLIQKMLGLRQVDFTNIDGLSKEQITSLKSKFI